ncbi:helix-turn-helix domain-containing protein [Paenibacillus woosongensis]|uniref:Helix-turn-helix domain-containing protein n=1 Tax=Paenibacillus woosongensis TaxID=307580 RepID=A0A7X3CMK4_9BACL|nr:AraC family transcriptional regulator [Paenibacillus woosongensis]MUG45295.1 helix-turn-helix domain-containing protein [Paenibacillus woosongensis]
MSRLITIRKKNYIMPGETELWYIPKNCPVYLEVQGRAILIDNKKQLELHDESVIILKKSNHIIKIQSHSTYRMQVQGFTFSNSSLKNTKEAIIRLNECIYFNELLYFGSNILEGNEVSLQGLSLVINEIVQQMNEVDEDSNCLNKIDTRLIKVHRHIRSHYNTPITLQTLGDLVGSHPTYLSNTFSKVFGISPIYYLNQLRINYGKEMLRTTQLPVTKIASLVGYTSTSQFSALFKRYTMMTPAEYKKSISTQKSKIN